MSWRVVLLVLVLLGGLWWASGLGRIPADPRAEFTEEQIERSKDYQRPRYVASVVSIVLGIGVMLVLAATPMGDRLLGSLRRWPWVLGVAAAVAAVFAVRALVRIPVSFWSGHLHERSWGFSTQSAWGWLADWAKGLGVSIVLAAVTFIVLFWAIRSFPRVWPAVAAVGAAALVAVLSFAMPPLVEPLFHRFTPLERQDPALARDLLELAERAEVPVRRVLVSDASRRTTKENAYVSGFGATRRLVVYDTLLRSAERDEVLLVAAHELGHRRHRHVELGTILGALGAAAMVSIVWLLIRSGAIPVGPHGPADPRLVPALLLAIVVVSLASSPMQNWISRQFETQADRFALELTGERDAYERVNRGLALRNLGNLDPGPIAYRFLYTHPSAAERLALADEVAPREG